MTSPSTDRMYSGRFGRGPDAGFDAFQRSFEFDRRLLPYELAVDRAWANALVGANILTADDAKTIHVALDEIGRRAQSEPAWLDASAAEDVHHFVEMELIARLGPLGARLHTGRSRNELIAADFRMFVRDAAGEMRRAVSELARALAALAESHLGLPMPGQTHLQRAQPILLSHYLMAQVEAFLRDTERLAAAASSVGACPLGSGALAGCAFPVDRQAIARELGFSSITANSLDAVSQRDFALEYLFALAALAVHLSRVAEDFALFASQEFAFIALPEEFSTGSSLMPQKKNPDAWELIRGKTGRVFGALTSLLTTLKGLPTGYQRDLQEDKEPLFAAHDQVLAMTRVAAGAVAATRFLEARLLEAASDPALLATEAADFLVLRGVPFRQAHEAVAAAVAEAERLAVPWTSLPLETLKKFSPHFDAELRAWLTVDAALARRSVPGGTAPAAVREAIAASRARLGEAE